MLVVGLSVGKRREIIGSAIATGGQVDIAKVMDKIPNIVQECVRYPNDISRRIFSNSKDDLAFIDSLPPYEVDPIVRTALILSGADRAAVEALAKNLKKDVGPSTPTG